MTLTTAEDPAGVPVTVWTLQMLAPNDLRPAGQPKVPVRLRIDEHADHQDPGRVHASAAESRFFYEIVGREWMWVDRLSWPDERWVAWVDRPEHHRLTCWVDGQPAGYAELDQQADEVELAYFGLLADYLGLGIGGWLLTESIRQAWSIPGTRRVWVHTCTLDAPPALGNYTARGFSVCEVSTEYRRRP